MPITNIINVEDIITITISDSTVITKIYIDSLDNSSNMYSTTDSLHTNVISTISQSTNIITIDASSLILDNSAFIVTLTYATGSVTSFYYDKEELYYAKVKLLTEPYNAILEDADQDLIQSTILRSNLFDYAVTNSLLEDQISLYKDLSRLLDISIITETV